ncbi:MAG: M56 family metallopeptidase [Candidatus Sumerlaeia bacterium]
MTALDYLNGFLSWLVRASMQASLLIVLILAVQALLRSRLSPAWRHGMWLLLLVRLALPWSPPSPMSLFNLLDRFRTPAPEVSAVQVRDEALLQSVKPLPTAPPVEAAPAPQPRHQTLDLMTWLAIVWLMGVAAFGGAVFSQTLMLRSALRNRRPVTDQPTLELLEQCKESMGIKAWLSIVEVPGGTGPALVGVLRPRLILPAGSIRALGPEQLRHVFMHELAHLGRNDIALNWLATLLQALHWFNPLIWLGFSRMRAEREMACDARVLSLLGPSEHIRYGRTIVHLLETFARPQTLPGLAGILEDQDQMKRRITMIAHFRKLSWAWSIMAAAVVIVLAGATLTGRSEAADSKYVKQKFDRPFVDDPAVLGNWESVDFVKSIDAFDPAKKSFKGDLFLKNVAFFDKGVSWPWRWTKGYLWHPGDKTEARYTIKTIDGTPYLFMEWISGDVTIRNQEPWYYVLKRSANQNVKPPTWPKPGENKYVKEKFDRAYVNDPAVIGAWQSVDFVKQIGDFDPAAKNWQGNLFWKGVTFVEGGATSGPWSWTKGYLWHPGDRTEAQYMIKEIGGAPYLFVEWISGDVTIRGDAPMYYVMKKSANQPAALTEAQRATLQSAAAQTSFPTPAQAARVQVGKSGLADAIAAFGEPLQYLWGNDTFTKDNLPSRYCMQYPKRFLVVIENGVVTELRHHEPGFVWDGLQVGSSMDEALKLLGAPAQTVENGNDWKPGILYKNLEGRQGWCYYARPDKGVRLFFMDGKICGLYQIPAVN